jgi:hypothetical protein
LRLLEPALFTFELSAGVALDFACTVGSEKTPSTNCERSSREQCIARYKGAGAPSTVWLGLYRMEKGTTSASLGSDTFRHTSSHTRRWPPYAHCRPTP